MSEEEEWKDIEGYEGLYQVSDLGMVKSLERHVVGRWGCSQYFPERLLKINNGDRYASACLCKNGIKKVFRVHKLVATHFIENPDNLPQVNHKDGIKSNNAANNLEWCTAYHNIHHAMENNLNPPRRGEQVKTSKLTDVGVIEIKRLLKSTRLLNREIASLFNVGVKAINNISAGKTWKHL